jgi:hypothetical protein
MSRQTSRREFLKAAGGAAAGLGLASVIAVEPARATPASMQEAIRKVVGAAQVQTDGSSSICPRSRRTATRCR